MVPGTRPASETSWLAVFRVPRTLAQPARYNPALVGHFLIIEKLEDHDIRVPILGMGREVAILRRIPVLVTATTNLHDLPRTVLLSRFSIWSTACESRLIRDAVTIVVVHISRQQGQSLLHVGQHLRLKAGADFLQSINGPAHQFAPLLHQPHLQHSVLILTWSASASVRGDPRRYRKLSNAALIDREAITLPLDHAFGFELADVGPAAIKMQRHCRRADGRGLGGSPSCDCGFGHVSNDASGARPKLVNQSRCERGPSTCHGRRLPESSTPHVLGILAMGYRAGITAA